MPRRTRTSSTRDRVTGSFGQWTRSRHPLPDGLYTGAQASRLADLVTYAHYADPDPGFANPDDRTHGDRQHRRSRSGRGRRG